MARLIEAGLAQALVAARHWLVKTVGAVLGRAGCCNRCRSKGSRRSKHSTERKSLPCTRCSPRRAMAFSAIVGPPGYSRSVATQPWALIEAFLAEQFGA